MCLNPITCPTTSKYVSLKYRDRFLYQFPCGRCVECQRLKSLQSSFRANYEFNDLPSGGYVMFDCLSYRNKDLPHLSDFWSMLPKYLDYPCFNRKHLRNFLQSLRQRLIRAGFGKGAVRYLYACEYGTSKGRTHRPHIHLMFYVHNPLLSPLYLSSLIADVWKFGRTDGVPYKSRNYVMNHNVVFPNNTGSRLRTVSYITKYLQKKSSFQKVLDSRVSFVMHCLAKFACPEDPDKWLSSELARRERLKLLRFVDQFSSTSQQFGASALRDIDFDSLCDTGSLVMPSSNSVKVNVPLSTYYKRKMFYDLVEVDGCRYWQLNELGYEYKLRRHNVMLSNLSKRFDDLASDIGIHIDSNSLSKYVLDDRGVISTGIVASTSIEQRLNDLSFYNYSTCSDKLNFGVRGLSLSWLGSPQSGYLSSNFVDRVSLPGFVSKFVYLDQQKESLISKLYNNSFRVVLDKGKQSAFVLRQRLSDLYKMISP